MIKNYLKIIWRNCYRQPIYTALNLACLSTGIAAALLIVLYLDFELNFDRFHEKKDQIFRVETTAIQTHEKKITVDWERTSGPFGNYVSQDFPEVEAVTRFFRFFQDESVKFEVDDKIAEEEQLLVADESVFEVFSYHLIYGNPKKALAVPNQIVLSASLARKLFGEMNPMGKVLNCELVHILPDTKTDYQLMVSGVYQDLPSNNHLPAEALISAKTDPRLADYEIGRFSFYTYILLKEEIQPTKLAEKLPQIYERYIDPEREPVLKYAIHELVPLTKIHLNETGGYTYLYIFAAIGGLILLISIISYVNLVTAQASRRALEIGVRKVMGAGQKQLIFQFLGESLFFTSIALVFALLMVSIAIGPLNSLLDLQLDSQQIAKPQVVFSLLGILLTLSILGGSYPAFFLSNFQPMTVLKGKLSKRTPLRSALVGIQFAVVLMVLVSTALINAQLDFLREKELGFNRTQIVQLNLAAEADLQKVQALKASLLENPLISAVGSSDFLPGMGMARRPLSADNGTSREAQFVHFGNIDYDFLETMEIGLVAGRNFSIKFPNDASDNLLINETLAKQFGLKNPVGERVRFGGKGNPNFKTIIGVVKDFHQSSLHQAIAPQMFLLAPANYNLAIKIEKNIPDALQHLEGTWLQIFPNTTYDFRFLDETLEANYEADQIRGNIFFLFTLLTIFITFLGLFGLVGYSAQQRVKEISVRRVLGANLGNIVGLISKEFLFLVLIAAFPAFLFAWFLIDNWLQDFAFRVPLNPWLFVSVTLSILLFTFGITSLHAIRTAQLNPAETLKNE